MWRCCTCACKHTGASPRCPCRRCGPRSSVVGLSLAVVHIHVWVSWASNSSNHNAANVCGSVSNAYSWYDTHIASVAVRELERGTHWGQRLELHDGGPTSLGTADSTAPNIRRIQKSGGRWGCGGQGDATADGFIVVRHCVAGCRRRRWCVCDMQLDVTGGEWRCWTCLDSYVLVCIDYRQ